MTVATRPAPRIDHEAIDAVQQLRAEMHALTARVAGLEARGGARDAAETLVLPAIASAIGARRFTSVDLLAHARVDPALADAIEAADVTNPREMGKLLARLETQPIAGLRLERVGGARVGVVWRVGVQV